MDVTRTAELRETYSLKSSAELRRIAESAEGQYTPEAAMVARELLSARPAEPSEPEGDSAPSASRGRSWRDIGAIIVVIYGAKQLFYTWRSVAHNPNALQEGVRRAVGDPWTYAVAAALVVWFWRSRMRGAA